MTLSTLAPISPAEVHGVLARHMLADGYDIVFDYEKSHGPWLHDARAGRDLLDFCSFFASNPVGFNHPKMKDPEFLKVLGRVAQLKPALADLYSVEFAWFVDVFGRLAMPPHLRYAFFIEGGTLGVENALKTAFDWKVRRHGQAPEDVDEPRVLDAVEVGERGLELRHPVQDLQELRVLHLRVVVADGLGREEGAEVEEVASRAGVVQPGPLALLVVEDDVVAVGEDAAAEDPVDLGGGDGGEGRKRHIGSSVTDGHGRRADGNGAPS